MQPSIFRTMNTTSQLQSEITSLQQQLKDKKQEFNEAIRNDKAFALSKKIYMEIKELERLISNKLKDNGN